MSNRQQVNVRLDEETKKRLEQWAKDEKRSLSNLMNFIIETAVEQHIKTRPRPEPEERGE